MSTFLLGEKRKLQAARESGNTAVRYPLPLTIDHVSTTIDHVPAICDLPLPSTHDPFLSDDGRPPFEAI